eukprot:scaffold442_cov397-Prasinococcus_capsulatus_cf.AAC.46
MVFYQAVMAGVISAETRAYELHLPVNCRVLMGFTRVVGCCGAYGFYERILGFYGLMGLLMSLLFFIAFIVILVAVASTTGKNKFIDECSDSMNSGTDGQTEEDVELHCEAYFETVKPPAVAILVIQLIITFLLATSSFLAFKLRWNASMASGQHVSKTVRYEPQEDEGTF